MPGHNYTQDEDGFVVVVTKRRLFLKPERVLPLVALLDVLVSAGATAPARRIAGALTILRLTLLLSHLPYCLAVIVDPLSLLLKLKWHVDFSQKEKFL